MSHTIVDFVGLPRSLNPNLKLTHDSLGKIRELADKHYSDMAVPSQVIEDTTCKASWSIKENEELLLMARIHSKWNDLLKQKRDSHCNDNSL